KTVHRRFQIWCRIEVLGRVLTDIANELRERGELDERRVLHRSDVCVCQARRQRNWRDETSLEPEQPPTQDRRRLSRYKRRWLVARFFAWIQWQHRILIRWE